MTAVRSGRMARSMLANGGWAVPMVWASSNTAMGTPTAGSGSVAGHMEWGSTAFRREGCEFGVG